MLQINITEESIKIGDLFYRYIVFGGFFEYKVIGIRVYQESKLFELECQACTHGYKCILLCALDDRNRLQYIRTLNEDEDNPQYYFHVESGEFYASKTEVIINRTKKEQEIHQYNISKAKETIEQSEKDLARVTETLEQLKEKLTLEIKEYENGKSKN